MKTCNVCQNVYHDSRQHCPTCGSDGRNIVRLNGSLQFRQEVRAENSRHATAQRTRVSDWFALNA